MGALAVEWYERAYNIAIKFNMAKDITSTLESDSRSSRMRFPLTLSSTPDIFDSEFTRSQDSLSSQNKHSQSMPILSTVPANNSATTIGKTKESIPKAWPDPVSSPSPTSSPTRRRAEDNSSPLALPVISLSSSVSTGGSENLAINASSPKKGSMSSATSGSAGGNKPGVLLKAYSSLGGNARGSFEKDSVKSIKAVPASTPVIGAIVASGTVTPPNAAKFQRRHTLSPSKFIPSPGEYLEGFSFFSPNSSAASSTPMSLSMSPNNRFIRGPMPPSSTSSGSPHRKLSNSSLIAIGNIYQEQKAFFIRQRAATAIQCAARKRFARNRTKSLKSHKQFLATQELRNQAAKKLQKVIKRFLAYKKSKIVVEYLRRKKLRQSEEEIKLENAALILQSTARGLLHRKKGFSLALDEINGMKRKVELMKIGFMEAFERERDMLQKEMKESVKKVKEECLKYQEEIEKLKKEEESKKKEYDTKTYEYEKRITDLEKHRLDDKKKISAIKNEMEDHCKRDILMAVQVERSRLQEEFNSELHTKNEYHEKTVTELQYNLTQRNQSYAALLEKCSQLEKTLSVIQYDEGMNIEAKHNRGPKWYRGTVVRCRTMGTYDIQYEDGDYEKHVDRNDIRVCTANLSYADLEVKFDVDTRVECRYQGGTYWYPAFISKVRTNGTFDISYCDGQMEYAVARDNVRMPVRNHNKFNVGPSSKIKYEIGQDVEMRYALGSIWFPAVITRCRTDESYDVEIRSDSSV